MSGAENITCFDAEVVIEPLLEVDENTLHLQVDGIPCVADSSLKDLWGEDFLDGIEEVLVHDWVLLRLDTNGNVLVADAGKQFLRGRSVWVDQGSCEGSDGCRQRLLLSTLLLVAAVKGIGNEFGVSSEHPVVEVRRDFLDVGTDDGQGLGDDFGLLWSQAVLVDIQVWHDFTLSLYCAFCLRNMVCWRQN